MIINYCSGGLGNRLKPLSSCYLVSKVTTRKLYMFWEPSVRCGANFKDLFKNDFTILDRQTFEKLDDTVIYTEAPYITHDANLNGYSGLLQLSQRSPVIPLCFTDTIVSRACKAIIVYNNDVFNVNGLDNKEFFKLLQPLDFIQDEIDNFTKFNSIDKNTIGVHVRGTDFNISVEYYINQMHQYKTERFFVCSDSLEYEEAIKNIFGDRVVFRKKDNYVFKNNAGSWVNNVQTPKESVQEALIDLYLLSKTDFKIYHPDSTFAHVAKLLG